MHRFLAFAALLVFPALCFSQEGTAARVIGRIPPGGDAGLYQIQVGSFKDRRNAEAVSERLKNASLNPVYERYGDFTRVTVAGIGARDIGACLDRIRALGFREMWVREDAARLPFSMAPPPPVSTAALPAVSSTEIGFRTVRVGETKNVAGAAKDKNISQWRSSTPSSFTVNSHGDVSGVSIGNGYVSINENEYISIAVVPAETLYAVPESQVALLPPESRTGNESLKNAREYRTEPTFRLAYRFNNKGENKGASGENGGIDILARGEQYAWLWTTYYQGGWFYDLNGVKRQMVNGYQKDDASGVELTVKPEFVYDEGVPYLQLRHIVRNTGGSAVSGQRFGASADVMIHKNDFASLLYRPYGAYMTDSETRPTVELMFIGLAGNGINPVDTLWLGTWGEGTHVDYIYDDARADVVGHDAAIGFSYKNIDLAADETKEFIVRFTLARRED
jgi:hypothetical protein